MPSAASVKVEKPPTSQNVATNNATTADIVDNNSPIRQVLVIIDHKIRNLEKRKSKLESYRDIEKSGKDLSADQKVAVSKYDEVAMTLDFAREFSKQIIQIAASSEKDLKKKQKKDETSKKQSEISKIREVLIIQDVLIQLSEEDVRKDFLDGTNGACKLEQPDLDLVDKFHSKIKPQRPSKPGGLLFKTAAQKSADHLVSTIDGKQKEFEHSTYGNLKTIFKTIQKSAYFDKASQPSVPADAVHSTSEGSNAVSQLTKDVETNVSGTTSEDTVNSKEGTDNSYVDGSKQQQKQQQSKQPQQQQQPQPQREFQEAPSPNAVPAPSFPPQPPINPVANKINAQAGPQKAQSILQTLPQLVPQQNILTPSGQQVTTPIQLAQVPPGHPLHGTHVQPTTVRAVEQAYFKQHQYIQQIRPPLADVLGPGSFFFLQESELDSPDVLTNASSGPTNSTQKQQPIPPSMTQVTQPPSQQPPTLHQSSQQSQIPNQNFTNQSFPNVVYTNMKPPNSNDAAPQKNQQLQQQAHLPGFATTNAPIPLPIVQQNPIPVATSNPQQSNNNSTNNAALGSFQPAGKYVASSTIPSSQSKIGDNSRNVSLKKNESLDQRIPEITDWKPEDAGRTSLSTKTKHSAHHGKESDDSNNNEWKDPYNNATNTTESGEWNPVTNGNGQDESNTWSSGNTSSQRYQYRQGSGGYRNGRPSGPGRNNSGNNVGPVVGPSNNTTNGYRGRPNSSYQSNNGRSNGNNNTNSSTFYRNNDPTYYQNGSRGTDKSDSYNRNGNYRARESRDNNTSGSSFKSGQPLPQRNNNQSNNLTGNRLSSGDNVDNRGHNNNSINNNQNQTHRSGNNPRGINAPNKHAGGGYVRPNAAGGVRSQPQQTINA